MIDHAGPPTAVLLMAYGSPRSRDEILPYYTDIRRGRPPTDAQLDDLTRRYEAIGGLSPLAARTEAQRVAIQAALDDRSPGAFRVVLGFKHIAPTIEDAVAGLADTGVQRIVGLVLAPHYSRFSVGEYQTRLSAAADQAGIASIAIDSWATEPALIELLAGEVRARLAAMPANTKVIFTAHSLPQRILAAGDRYPDEVRATAAAVAARVGLDPWSGWSMAWQSAGRTADPWLGPDVRDVISQLATSENGRGALICACGFVADHLEVLYDLDIEARAHAEQCGVAFDRTACVNDDPTVMAALAERVVAATRTSA